MAVLFEKFTLKRDGRGAALGFALGVIISMWFGFDILKFKTAGSAEALAKQQSAQAVLNAYGNVCAKQVRASKDGEALIAKIKGMERYSRGDVVVKAGFASVTDEKDAPSGIGQACADVLVPEPK